MSAAASLPAEVLSVIFEHLFFTKDLLCAALVNRSWRAACVNMKKLWRRHWQFTKQDDTHRHRVLAKDPSEIDWFAETSAAVRREAAWRSGKFTARTIKLPPHFSELQSVDDETALIMLRRPGQPGEVTAWGGDVKTFKLVDKNTFETIHDLPQIPGEFPEAENVNGLGHVFSIVVFPHTYFYIPEDGYKWLGSPPKAPGQKKLPWPKLPGFVFIGRQEIKSEGSVKLYVDGAHTQTPALSIHEQDTDNLNWIRYGPWKGQRRMINTGDESFCSHSLTDECVIITSHNATILVRHRTNGEFLFLSALRTHAAQYTFDRPESPVVDSELDDLIQEIQHFVPTSSITQAQKTTPVAETVKGLLQLKKYVFCSQYVLAVTPIGKHLCCVVGNGIVLFPSFARPFEGHSKRAPLLIDLGGAPVSLAACGSRLVIIHPTAFYVVDGAQFDGDEPPAQVSAVKVTRSGVIASQGYGHRVNNKEKGATAKVTVTTESMYEVLKIDHSWWDEETDNKKPAKGEKKPVDHFVRIYNFE